VLRAQCEEKVVVVGLVVDAVSDVYKVEQENIKSSPDFGRNVSSQFLLGMATIEDKIIIILDANKFLSVDELYRINTDGTPQTMAS